MNALEKSGKNRKYTALVLFRLWLYNDCSNDGDNNYNDEYLNENYNGDSNNGSNEDINKHCNILQCFAVPPFILTWSLRKINWCDSRWCINRYYPITSLIYQN